MFLGARSCEIEARGGLSHSAALVERIFGRGTTLALRQPPTTAAEQLGAARDAYRVLRVPRRRVVRPHVQYPRLVAQARRPADNPPV